MGDKKKLKVPPSFIGDKVYLRPATAEDVANSHHWQEQCEPTSRSCRPMPFMSAAEVAESYGKRERSPNIQLFMIIKQKDKTPVGQIRFFDMNTLNRSAEFGLLVDPDEQKNGYGLEATRILCRYLFRSRGLNKVYAQTGSFNKAAIKLLEKVGFKLDGTLRRHMFHDGEFHDALVYSILQHEFER